MNKSTWDDLKSQSDDGTFLCPFSRTVLTIDDLRRNTLAADLIKQRDSDKELKKIMQSDDHTSQLVQQMIMMHSDMHQDRSDTKQAMLDMSAQITTLSKVIAVSHKQVMNLSGMTWCDTFAMTVAPCTKSVRLERIKNRKITKADRDIFKEFMEKNLAKPEKQKKIAQSTSSPSAQSEK